jgi:hypothetical protein
MIYKIVTGTSMIITGLFSELMGLLFAITYSGAASRIIAAGIFFAAGIPLLVFGFIIFKSGMIQRPEIIQKKLLKTAQENKGKLTEEIISAATGWNSIVSYELNEMIKKRIVKKSEKDGQTYYIFPKFQPKYVMNKCPYCGIEYQVRDDVLKCPSCKGDLKFLNIKP